MLKKMVVGDDRCVKQLVRSDVLTTISIYVVQVGLAISLGAEEEGEEEQEGAGLLWLELIPSLVS